MKHLAPTFMKRTSETLALEKLRRSKSEFAKRIRADYEHRAKSCASCATPGACCLDAHFVNVHITPLEAAAIRARLDILDNERRASVHRRVDEAIRKYALKDEGDTFAQTFACPLFETGTGCLVHGDAKPLPCITHACYERKEDLPPDELLAEQEAIVDKMNERLYAKPTRWLPLPIALRTHGR